MAHAVPAHTVWWRERRCRRCAASTMVVLASPIIGFFVATRQVWQNFTPNFSVLTGRGIFGRGCPHLGLVLQRATEVVELKKLKVAELQERLRGLGLTTSGRKADLVIRLETATSQDKPHIDGIKTVLGDKANPVASLSIRSSAPDSTNSAFRPGDHVSAMRDVDGGNAWHSAIVQKNYGDGTLLITWVVDNTEYMSRGEDIKLNKASKSKTQLVAGDSVEALYEEDGEWYPAKVVRNNGDGTLTISWYGIEEVCKPRKLRLPSPKLLMRDVVVGKKYRGTVRNWFNFGTFIDIGAEREGLVYPFRMFPGAEPVYTNGDLVEVCYDDDNKYYGATVKKDNGDGTFIIRWQEDGQEFMCNKEQMRLLRQASLEEGTQVDVWVAAVQDSGKLELSLVRGKVGANHSNADFSKFEAISSDEWLVGIVRAVMPFGLVLAVRLPNGGPSVQGIVQIAEIREGFVEDIEAEAEVGQEIEVRVMLVDAARQRLFLSMKK